MPKAQSDKVKVHFSPDNVEILVKPGTNLLEVAIDAGVHIYASCGGVGTCGTCKVLVKQGEVETIRTRKVTDEEYSQGIRQACQSRVLTDLEVYVPVESRLEKAVLSREGKKVSQALAAGWRFRPPLSKCYVELSPPTLEDNMSDLSRLLRGLKKRCYYSNIQIDFEIVKKLPQVLRRGNWKVTVTTLVTAAKPQTGDTRRPRIINVEPGDTREKHFGLAIDIGTTTVCAQLLDLNRGQVLSDKIEYNNQISYGSDVISRINYCQRPGGLKKLQKAVVTNINSIIGQMVTETGVKLKDIGHITVAGNTTMTQILLGLDPKYIRLTPYVPTATFYPPVEARTLGIKVRKSVYIFAFPAVASYVGGDIVSGIVGAGVHQRKTLTLFIDIGTNGEIVLGNSDWMVTTSASAGPAFEGGGIKHGMVAISGAIEGFSINQSTLDPEISTVNNAKPKGICGSGLINTVAALLEAGVIGQDGKFKPELEGKRIRSGPDGREYVLAWAAETQIEKDIVITEVDINNLIRAKGAIYAAARTLARSVGLIETGFEQVIIAGAFGSHLNVEKAITIGLLPDLPQDKFIFVGNGALMGARLISFSTDLLDDARRVANMMTNIELAENVDFMNNYVAALFLPHTNADEFPTVKKKLARLNRKVAA